MNTVAQAFRDSLCDELKSRPHADRLLSAFTRELQAIDCTKSQTLPPLAKPATVTKHLQTTLNALGCGPALASAVQAFAQQARWYQIFEGDGIDPVLADGLVAGLMAGQGGVVETGTLRTGLFLLAPGIHYPLHQHGALELYFVVSGRLTLQYGTANAPFHVDAGDLSITPSNVVHALTTQDEPCLVIYTWIGDIESPNWWWTRTSTGTWERICWERRPDGSWIQTRKEPITDEVWKEAGED